MKAASCLALSLVCLVATAQTPKPVSPSTVFETLKGLQGEWTGRTATGRALKVTYTLLAAGTVVVEHWTLSPTRDSMTVYHLNGSDLLATHYCPIGNQPRLKYVPGASNTRFDFTFMDATNLTDPAKAHQQAFTLEVKDASTLIRSETYLEKGQPDSETTTFTRVPPLK